MRKTRERELVAATRALFDERGRAASAGRGDRAGRRHRPRADLPPLLLQGGALRPHGHRLPARARRRAARPPSPARAGRSPSSRAAPAPTPASACATRPSWTASLVADARPGRASCTSSCPSRSGCASARAWRAASTTSPTMLRAASSRATSTSTTPTTSANVLWTQGARHHAPRADRRGRPPGGARACPASSRSSPSGVVATCVEHAMAAVGASASGQVTS